MPITRIFNREFFRIWSPEMAYVLGFMFADGYVYRNSAGGMYFCFCSTDAEIIEQIRTVLDSNHKIGCKFTGPSRPNIRNLYVLQIGSVEVCRELAGFGIVQNKSLIVKFPAVRSSFLGQFIRGYFDGDGCVHFGTYWRKDRRQWKDQLTVNFTSGSKIFLEGLFLALKPYCTGGRIGSKKGGYELIYGQHDSIALFDLMYNNVPAGLFLERKYAHFQRAFQKLKLQR